MKIPRDVVAYELIKVIIQYGYNITRQTGSHIRLTNKDGSHNITIPNHSPIKVGTLSSIIKDICSVNNISISDFIRKL